MQFIIFLGISIAWLQVLTPSNIILASKSNVFIPLIDAILTTDACANFGEDTSPSIDPTLRPALTLL